MRRVGLQLRVVLLVAMTGLTGCFRTVRLVQRTKVSPVYLTAPVSVLETQVSERDASIKTLNAQVLITASTGGGKEGKVTEYTSFRGYIFVRKPRDLRVLLQLPVIGSRALDMVSDGKTFTLLIPPRNRAIVGTNEVTKPSKNGLENLRPAVFFDSLLVPGVPEGRFVLPTESTRVLQPESRHKDAVEEPDYDLTIAKVRSGNLLQAERVLHISRVDLLPFQQDIYDESGRVVVTQATYEHYQLFGGIEFPMLINIRRPLDEYSLKIEVVKVTLNESLENDQFELKVPPGMTVQRME